MKKQSVVSVSLDRLDPDEAQLVQLCCEASTLTVETYGDPKSPRPQFPLLRNITFGAAHYDDKGTACPCAVLRLFKYGDTGYTVCAAHGLQEIGYLRRELINGHGRRP